MNGRYILKGKTAVPCDGLMDWAEWIEKGDRLVAKTKVGNVAEVSTVFLGLDHSFGRGLPVLFETMVFGGKLDQQMDRYHTWEEAELGHQIMVREVEAAEGIPPKI